MTGQFSSLMAMSVVAATVSAAPTYWLDKAEVGFDLVLGRMADKAPSAHVTPASLETLSVVTNGAGVVRRVCAPLGDRKMCYNDFKQSNFVVKPLT